MSSTGKKSRLLQTVESALRDAGVTEGSSVLAGVSGGPDSTCLLHALSVLSGIVGFSPIGCLVDHGIRSEEERLGDAEHVRSLCLRLGVPLIQRAIASGECARVSRSLGRSLEETARDMRLAQLSEAADESGCGWIALGHTLDDQAETMIMRFLQGSDPAGLKGISSRRGRIVRPLLACPRSDVLEYLDGCGIPYRLDPSNRDERFLRNLVRHRILPPISEAFPGYRRSLAAMAGRLGMWAQFVSSEAERALPWQEDGERLSLPRSDFFSAHPALRMGALYTAFQRLRTADSPRRLPSRFLNPALGGDPQGARGILLQGHGILVRYDAKSVSAGRSIVSGRKKGYLLIVEAGGEYPIPGTRIEVRCSVRDADGSSGRELCIPATEIGSPCVLRSRRPGDVLEYGGGLLSLKKLYSEWGVPENGRWAIPVLADRKGIFLVLGDALGLGNRRARRPGDSGGSPRMCFSVQRR
jgi:tRNA(Ile)-lysidine synthase